MFKSVHSVQYWHLNIPTSLSENVHFFVMPLKSLWDSEVHLLNANLEHNECMFARDHVLTQGHYDFRYDTTIYALILLIHQWKLF